MSKIISVTILVTLLCSIYFLHLGWQPLRLWDESRYAENAYEMSNNGNLIVTYFGGQPENWNSKPPLMIWCQAFCVKLFGPKEISFRLPAAICGFLTSLLLFIYCWKYHDKFWMGFFAALILATTKGFIDEHGVRYGETEGVYIFFQVLYCLAFFEYLETGKIKYFFTGIAGITLSMLTKGIAGSFVIPVIAFAAIAYHKAIKILSSKHFYMGAGIILFFVGGYYILREHYNPGYLKMVQEFELGGRYLKPIEGHKEPFLYYYYQITQKNLSNWSLLIICGFIAGVFSIDLRMKRFIFFISSCILFLFLLLSFSQTKLSYYIYTLIPFLVLLISYFLWIVFTMISNLDVSRILRLNILPYLFAFLLLINPYRAMLERVYLAPENEWDMRSYSMSYYLRGVLENKMQIQEPLKVVYAGYRAHLDFYVHLLQKKNIAVTSIDPNDIKVGDNIVCSREEDLKTVDQHFLLQKTGEDKNLWFFKIIGIKS